MKQSRDTEKAWNGIYRFTHRDTIHRLYGRYEKGAKGEQQQASSEEVTTHLLNNLSRGVKNDEEVC